MIYIIYVAKTDKIPETWTKSQVKTETTYKINPDLKPHSEKEVKFKLKIIIIIIKSSHKLPCPCSLDCFCSLWCGYSSLFPDKLKAACTQLQKNK